ncbi:hypothetical protein FSP39_019947 [Pinctada imbricata]|uniref:Uncharacterized protein n=1 Tax=Pinctada imbricata TaxID=66713 RepID=A0AA88YP23_PINIB|nr:hypothetical protein FSP39_019947 [Pinctada imbricata]
MVCDSDIVSGHREVFEPCENLCHIDCIKEVHENSKVVKLCISCAASEEQQRMNNDTRSHMLSTTGPIQPTVLTPANTDASAPESEDVQSTTPKTVATATLQQLPQQKETSDRQTSSIKEKSTRSKSSSTIVDGATVKMKDVRTKEQRLRKWEEELKIREAQLNQHEAHSQKKDAYIARLEAQNIELERSIRILRRRIAMLEENSTKDETPNTENKSHSKPTDKLLSDIQDRVTKSTVDKVDKQPQQLTENPTNTTPTSSMTTRHANPHDVNIHYDIQHRNIQPARLHNVDPLTQNVNNVTQLQQAVHVPLSQHQFPQHIPRISPRNNAVISNLHPGIPHIVARDPLVNQSYRSQYSGAPIFYRAPNPNIMAQTNATSPHHFLGQRPLHNIHR